ncbi:MAG: MBL fold metallo-hydrolase [Microthrixaceae bacterium]
MPGIHRLRPGASQMAAATDAAAIDLGDNIWMSPGWSNSYMLPTEDGRVIINTGMGFEGPLHRRAYDKVDNSEVLAVMLTQGHYDHVGGIDLLKDPESTVIAQASFTTWREDNERLETFRSRNSAFAFMDAILAAMEYATSVGVGSVPQGRPEPTLLVEDRLDLTLGGRQMELYSTPGGETFDSMVIWLPESRTLFSGNLFGPLFGHVPNLVTIRGDRYRDALSYIDSLNLVLDLAPDRLITGHFDPILGAAEIAEEVRNLQEAMQWVHDRTVDGMNSGADVYTLMQEVEVPEHLDIGEGYGQTKWNVRAIWENYAGWFHHRSTSELFARSPLAMAPDLVKAAGEGVIVELATAHLQAGRTIEALQLTEILLAASPSHQAGRKLAQEAHRLLLVNTTNFWEQAWLRRSLTKLESQ